MPDDDNHVDALCNELRLASAAAAYEGMGRGGDVDVSIRALVPDMLCVGIAYTVRAPAGYADEIVKAVDHAPAGSVIVISMDGPGPSCTWGGTGTLVACRRGVAGVITDGHVRDISEIRHTRFPMFARGTIVSGWQRGGAGSTGVDVSVGGQTVRHGDVICADDDGIVVIPRARAVEVLGRLRERLAYEDRVLHIVQSGGSYADVMHARMPRIGEDAPIKQQDTAHR